MNKCITLSRCLTHGGKGLELQLRPGRTGLMQKGEILLWAVK
jgi:hypothetical protein